MILKFIFNIYMNVNYCSQHFKKSITIILRKSEKDDYTQIKTYRSIILFNTIDKVLKKIMINRISELIE